MRPYAFRAGLSWTPGGHRDIPPRGHPSVLIRDKEEVEGYRCAAQGAAPLEPSPSYERLFMMRETNTHAFESLSRAAPLTQEERREMQLPAELQAATIAELPAEEQGRAFESRQVWQVRTAPCPRAQP